MSNFKNNLSKVKTSLTNKIDSLKTKASVFVATTSLAMADTVSVYASGNTGKQTNAQPIVEKIIDIVVSVFPLIGAFFIVAGALKIFLAYRNNQPEEMTTAAKDIIIGAVFVVFDVFVWDQIKGFVF